MANNIKSFEDFKSESVNENWFSDGLSGLLGYAGNAFSDVLKGKASAYLLSFFGIGEQSIFSKLVQNFVEQIPVADLTKIIFAGKANSAYLAPKMADATIEFLTEKGLDGIAQDLGIEQDGWIYRTISEMLANQARREDFRNSLESFYLQAFNGFEGAADKDDFMKSLSSTEERTLKSGIDRVIDVRDKEVDMNKPAGDLVSDFLSGLAGNGQSLQSLGLSSGGTIQ
jgi:hypothetical protein